MIEPERFLNLLSIIPELEGAPASLSDRLRGECLRLEAPEGEILFQPGDECTGLPLLFDGTVRVGRPVADGSEVYLYRLRPGELCAMTTLAMLANTPHISRATVEAPLDGLVLPRSLVLDLLERFPSLRERMFRSLARETERIIGRLEEVTVLDLEHRLAARLLSEGPRVEATHQELAEELTCSREMVSRILARFQRAGTVRLSRGRVEVVRPGGLEEVVRDRD